MPTRRPANKTSLKDEKRAVKMLEQGLPYQSIADAVGIGYGTVVRIRKAHGLPDRDTPRAVIKKALARYRADKQPVHEIAADLGVHESSIQGWASQAGVPLRLEARYPDCDKQALGAVLRRLRGSRRRQDIAERVGCSLRTLDADERGELSKTGGRGVPTTRLKAYAAAYGTTVEKILAEAKRLAKRAAKSG